MIKRLISYYIYSNLHISLCAAIYLCGGFILYQLVIDWSLIALTFTATLVSYNLHRFIGLKLHEDSILPNRFTFIQSNKLSLLIINGIAVFIATIALYFVPYRYYFFLIPMGFLTFLYLIPLFGNSNRLRDFPYIKIGLICLVWSMLFLLPQLSQHPLNRQSIDYLLLIEKCCFFLALTIPFDLRDAQIDQEQGVKTLGNLLSLDFNKKIIAIASCLSALLTIYFGIVGFYSLALMLWALGFYAALVLLTYYSTRQSSELYFLGILDGVILVHGLMYILTPL